MAEHAQLDVQIAETRARLETNLTELRDRARHARTMMSPRTYLDNPWFRVGVGLLAGFLIVRWYRR